MIACVSATVGMRFPAPSYVGAPHDFALRSDAKVPRCVGYVPDDPKTDPYTPFYPGWHGTRTSEPVP